MRGAASLQALVERRTAALLTLGEGDDTAGNAVVVVDTPRRGLHAAAAGLEPPAHLRPHTFWKPWDPNRPDDP